MSLQRAQAVSAACEPDLPRFILAQVGMHVAVSPPTHIKIGRSLLSEILVCKHKQTKWTMPTAKCSAAAHVAVVILHCTLKFPLVDHKLGFYVNLNRDDIK